MQFYQCMSSSGVPCGSRGPGVPLRSRRSLRRMGNPLLIARAAGGIWWASSLVSTRSLWLGSAAPAWSQGQSVRAVGNRVPQGAAPGGPATFVSPGQHRASGLFAPGRQDHNAVAVRAFRQELVFPVAAVQEGPEASVSFGQQSPGAGWAEYVVHAGDSSPFRCGLSRRDCQVLFRFGFHRCPGVREPGQC